MKKSKSITRSLLIVVILSISSIFNACRDEVLEQPVSKDKPAPSDRTGVFKDFEIQPSWLGEEGNENGRINTYTGFGQGVDILNGERKISIFKAGSDITPLISTHEDELATMKYVSSSVYEEIQNNVESQLTAYLNVDISKFRLDASLSVENQKRITSRNNSVYVSVLYIKNFGEAWVEYDDPTINQYLKYRTGIVDGGSDGITMNSTAFRNNYGDKFRYMMGFGVLLNVTIQVTDVSFETSTRTQVAAAATAAIAKMVELGGSWDSVTEGDSRFSSSSLVIDGYAIPRVSSFIFDFDDLLREIAYMDYIYDRQDLGNFWSGFRDYKDLYPSYNFININQIRLKLDSWWKTKAKLERWESITQNGTTLDNEIRAEITKCSENIGNLEQFISVDYPSTYSYLFDKVKLTKFKNLYREKNVFGNNKLYVATSKKKSSDVYLGRVFKENIEPALLKPIFDIHRSVGNDYHNDRRVGGQGVSSAIDFYLYKSTDANTNPIFRGEKGAIAKYNYATTAAGLSSYDDDIKQLGYIEK